MPQSPDPDHIRQIKQSGTRWRYRDIPNRYLSIGRTNEAQELFDSGYIGDNGTGNQDLRLHVYYGNLIIDTNDKAGQNISITARLDNLITSGRHTKIESKGNLEVSSAINTNLSVTGNMNSNINGSVREEVHGIDGYTRDIKSNFTETIGNNYKSTIGQNYTSTVGLDAQYNSRNSTYNTSELFNIISEKDANLTGKQNVDVSGTNQVRINSTNDVLLQGKNLGATIVETINTSCNNYTLRCSNNFNSQINGDFVQSVTKDASYSVGGSYSNVNSNMTVKSNKIDVSTSDANGPISFQFGTGSLAMNGSVFTTPSNSKLNLSTEFEAIKVWKAVYN